MNYITPSLVCSYILNIIKRPTTSSHTHIPKAFKTRTKKKDNRNELKKKLYTDQREKRINMNHNHTLLKITVEIFLCEKTRYNAQEINKHTCRLNRYDIVLGCIFTPQHNAFEAGGEDALCPLASR